MVLIIILWPPPALARTDDGTIKFRKPKKTKSDGKSGKDKKKQAADPKEKRKTEVKKVKNTALLSFGDDEEE